MNGNFRNRENPIRPVSVGETLNVEIETVGEKGDGITKRRGLVIFVPKVSKGDKVKIKITKVLQKVAFAEKIGEADGPIESDNARKERPRGNFIEASLNEEEKEETKKEEPQFDSSLDSEDFGEDLEEESEEETEGLEDLKKE